MKYSMRENERLGGLLFREGVPIVPAVGQSHNKTVVAYHEAAEEFWQRIQELEAVQRELVAACEAAYYEGREDASNDELGYYGNLPRTWETSDTKRRVDELARAEAALAEGGGA